MKWRHNYNKQRRKRNGKSMKTCNCCLRSLIQIIVYIYVCGVVHRRRNVETKCFLNKFQQLASTTSTFVMERVIQCMHRRLLLLQRNAILDDADHVSAVDAITIHNFKLRLAYYKLCLGNLWPPGIMTNIILTRSLYAKIDEKCVIKSTCLEAKKYN